MARPMINAVDVERLDEDGCAQAITIRTNQGHATRIDFSDGKTALDKMLAVCMTVGLDHVEDTDDLVGRRLMTRSEVAAWRRERLSSLFDW